MIVEFFDRQEGANPLNGARMSDGAKVLDVLEELRNRDPFFCELIGENGYNLLIGLGGTIGCAQYSSGDGSQPYLVAVENGIRDSATYTEFLTGNTLTPVAGRYCLPFEVMRQIVVYFVETGHYNPAVPWEEI